MANRYQDDQSGRSRGTHRDWEDRGNEAEGPARGGNHDQGRVQYGRDTEDQSGSTGRYAGYGDWGQGNYDRSGRGANTGQNRYGQSGYGGGNYGTGQGVRGSPNYSGSGGDDHQSSRGGGRSDPDYGYSGYGSEGRAQRGWDEPAGDDQQPGADRAWGRGGGGAQYGNDTDRSSRGPHRGKGPKGYQRSDERVKEMISERLREDPHVDASDITVTVSGGKVTLDGTVDSRQAKNSAEDIAEHCGCEDVQNNLRVQRAQESGSSRSGSGTDMDKEKERGESARQRH